MKTMPHFVFGDNIPLKDPTKIKYDIFCCNAKKNKKEVLKFLQHHGYVFDFKKMMDIPSTVLAISIFEDKAVYYINIYSLAVQEHHGAKTYSDLQEFKKVILKRKGETDIE